MMSRVCRLLLIFLVVVALPLRGYAATTMQFCGSSHHAGMDATGAAHATHHGEAGSSHAGHGHAEMHHGDEGGAAADTPESLTTCSACGACCLGAAAAPSLTALGFERGSTLVASTTQAFSGIVLEAAERPPLYLVRK